ncbi:hypothetical protein [Mesoplasma lactucae]|uniref:Uncharacterized protein n=1 Tax=Mesoplasma lactucae ATCC 49193 TaxID=81460 RepID=A0A291IRX4_9MOLU|nr:hypothetical protein [Mesoplasma lactucae]ATG97612.1 hypothetical protein CP520_02615 [Mesoplasma lactucae ATCC 49193]ATZ19927.1 hypothetical protein MLACT_v1c01030 [Mesoplasma lactucae ATCC 49193]MCL8216791.1 hypothetical protein [Mesoplasma lactucae ATCC 49193]
MSNSSQAQHSETPEVKQTKKANRQNFTGTLIGVSISLINAIIQFMMIYWVLNAYGTEFNGFIRVSAALSTLGGSTEGALGVSTVVLMIKPLQNNDFITTNEIFSTAKKRYRAGMISNTIVIALLAVLYPLEIVVSPTLLKNAESIQWDVALKPFTDSNNVQTTSVAPFYQLVLIFLCFGIKNIITAGCFGAYENVIQADQQNGSRRLIILFTDLVIYGTLFYLLNLTKANGGPIDPLYPFLILIAYGPLRGLLIMIYVKRNYDWLKFYPDFDSFQLKRTSAKMLSTTIGRTILFNTDIVLVMLVLGGYGLRTSSMLSLYLIIGVNTRQIMANFITSFREYFVSIVAKEGRLYWESYSKYELYMYSVAGFTFILMSILSPYIVNALYGSAVSGDLMALYPVDGNGNVIMATNQGAGTTALNGQALWNVYDFMFKKPLFSILYAGSTSFILLIQGQYTLVEAKERVDQVAKMTDIIAGLYLAFAIGLSLIFSIPQKGDNFIINTLIAFYSTKLSFMAICYGYLWAQNWNRGTYNSDFSHVLVNLLALVIPVAIGILGNYFAVQKIYPIDKMEKIGPLFAMILIIFAIDLGLVIVTSLSLRPKVAVSLILMLPIVKQIVAKSKSDSRYKRLRDANINPDDVPKTEVEFNNAISPSQQQEFNVSQVESVSEVFKPKVYKLKREQGSSVTEVDYPDEELNDEIEA